MQVSKEEADQTKSGSTTRACPEIPGGGYEVERGSGHRSGIDPDTARFFADVTQGFTGRPFTEVPFVPLHNIAPHGDFIVAYEQFRSNFDRHIACSIPGHYEVQVIKGTAICELARGKSEKLRMLDIGSSEGSLIKAISLISQGQIWTTGLEPNPAMFATFFKGPQVHLAECELAAFGTQEQAGLVCDSLTIPDAIRSVRFPEVKDGLAVIRYYEPECKFDIIHESETFQFIDNERASQIKRCRELLKFQGILICEEKFLDSPQVYWRHESRKDQFFKSHYFPAMDIEAKRKAILSGGVSEMERRQVRWTHMEKILKSYFPFVCMYWVAGNFRGYAASAHKQTLASFVKSIGEDSRLLSVIKPRFIPSNGGE